MINTPFVNKILCINRPNKQYVHALDKQFLRRNNMILESWMTLRLNPYRWAERECLTYFVQFIFFKTTEWRFNKMCFFHIRFGRTCTVISRSGFILTDQEALIGCPKCLSFNRSMAHVWGLHWTFRFPPPAKLTAADKDFLIIVISSSRLNTMSLILWDRIVNSRTFFFFATLYAVILNGKQKVYLTPRSKVLCKRSWIGYDTRYI